jgi:hypothetical protein
MYLIDSLMLSNTTSVAGSFRLSRNVKSIHMYAKPSVLIFAACTVDSLTAHRAGFMLLLFTYLTDVSSCSIILL